MTDTTKIEFIGKEANKIIDSLNQRPTGMSSGEIALLAAIIGALAAILTQVLFFYLTRHKEISNLRKELVANERRIAYLLSQHYKELVMHKVHKQYWYRTSVVFRPGTEDSSDSHKRHFKSNQKSFEILAKIHETTSEYFKTVTHFTVLTGQNDVIDNLLNGIKLFEPRKASDFSYISNYEDLLEEQPKEEKALNTVYLFYSESFDRINSEMKKKI